MSRVIAILTLYYPKREHLINLSKIAEQVDRLIVCDNSPFINEDLKNEFPTIIYQHFGKNLGLSAGFNRVLKNAKYKWHDDDFIIFFDQDTTIPKNHIISLIDDYEYLEKHGYKVGTIGPVFFNKSLGKEEIPTIKQHITKSIFKVKSVITTSMLCKYSNIKLINFWNEEIFLDMADWDLSWRFTKSNKACFMSSNSIILHSVGENKKKLFSFNIRVWKPFREYYQIRDSLYLLNKNYVPWNFRIRLILNLTIRPLIHICFLDNTYERIKYIIKGYRDYFKGQHGELTT